MTGSHSETDLKILRKKSPLPEELPSLESLFHEADAAQWDLVVVTEPQTPEKAKARSKRRHDFKAASRTIQLLVKALHSGYRFDDAEAQAKIDAIARAATVLEKETHALDRILAAE